MDVKMGIENIVWPKQDINEIQDEIVKRAMKEMSDQLDRDLLWDLIEKDKFPYSHKESLDVGDPSPRWVSDQDAWMIENFGRRGDKWDWHRGSFYFKSEADKLAFILRWS